MNSFRFTVLVLLLSVTNFIFSQQDLNSQFTVVIDPGHGGKDPGAVSNGYYEKIIALSTSLKLGKLLQDNGVNGYIINYYDSLNSSESAGWVQLNNNNAYIGFDAEI